MIKLSTKIKELRLRDGRTQEELAESVGVTAQAVSRWEKEVCYPDMELIPSIANYFHVSIDELFGYDNDRERKIDEIIKRSEELHRVDRGEDIGIDECIAFLRDGLIEFPGNERIMLRLVVVLRDAGYVREGHRSLWDKDGYFTPDIERHRKNQYWREAIKLLERMNSTASGEMLYEVRYELLCLYDCIGEYDKAYELANTFPILQLSRSAALGFASSGIKRVEYGEKYLIILFNELVNQMVSTLQLCKNNYDGDTAKNTVENAIKLSELFFTDGNYGRFHGTLVQLYLYLSSLQWRAGLKDETFASLYKALDHAKAFQALADEHDTFYTTPLLRHVRIESSGINSGINRDPLTLAEDWPWWAFPDTRDIESDIKSDPRWDEWVRKTKE